MLLEQVLRQELVVKQSVRFVHVHSRTLLAGNVGSFCTRNKMKHKLK